MCRVRRRLGAAAAIGIAAAALAACGGEEPFRIGVVWPCQDVLVIGDLKEAYIAGTELPLLQRGARALDENPTDGVSGIEIAGRPVELVLPCGDGGQRDGLAEARRLVEEVGVDAVMNANPLDNLMEYARTRPDVTFLGLQDLRDPAPNVFGFYPTNGMFIAGLGTYAYEELGWRTVAVIGEDGAENFEAAGYFVAEFCSLGGTVAGETWLQQNQTDVETSLASVPDDVDGYYVSTYWNGKSLPVLAALTARDPELGSHLAAGPFTLLEPVAQTAGPVLDGAAGGLLSMFPLELSPQPGFADLAAVFPKQIDLATYAGLAPVTVTPVEGLLRALERAEGDPGGQQERLRQALHEVTVDAQWGGTLHLDDRGQAVGDGFVLALRFQPDGNAGGELTKTYEDVDQTLGGLLGPDTPPFGRNSQPCVAGNPPPWAEQG